MATNSEIHIVDFIKSRSTVNIRKRSVNQFVKLTTELKSFNWPSVIANFDSANFDLLQIFMFLLSSLI